MSAQEEKKPRKKTMSREQADALYHQLKKNMQEMMTREKGAPRSAKPAAYQKKSAAPKQPPVTGPAKQMKAEAAAAPRTAAKAGLNRGHHTAIALVAACLCIRIILSAMSALGIGTVDPAQATIPGEKQGIFTTAGEEIRISKEEVRLLTSLDTRRSELEERNKRLDEREADLKKRDSEFAIRMAEIRELTDKLKVDRERNDKKRETQLGQLANVYGSMNPQEAATLMEKLDSQIALALITRMPEKRIGQILALMSPDKALTMTKMLSNGNTGK